ncbi:MAG TPA: EAL domain-containing protein [Accumulibacter sp.]|nr:EAL domain-containing protein [Accumulibacter sp.]HND80857.1 EAL domain-containing protein [Accumulibacter sp.]HNE12257.1 EAL domain-containing protein [Accumulibacter sp.]HNG39844.1 EAL domain-containing protein [Accumulibacter sp.]HNH23785.1 EAL domain-containing protein [Accumulibacter sp.]
MDRPPPTPINTPSLNTPPGDTQMEESAVKTAKILIVQPDEASAELLQSFLASAGYLDIASTPDTETVQALLVDYKPDVVLLDSDALTGLGGEGLLEKLSSERNGQQRPLMVLSANLDRKLKLRILQSHDAQLLAKPVDPAELLLRLHNTLVAKALRERAAFHDELTGLPNRERYVDRLDWAIRYSQRYGGVGAVLHISLDRFQQVVNALGWGVGDRLLRATAQNLLQTVRSTDIITLNANLEDGEVMLSRLTGNEFTALLTNIDRPDRAAMIARRILPSIQTPFRAGSHELISTCSIGIAIFPDDGTTRDDIMRAANNALQHAINQGGNTFNFYARDLNDRAIERLRVETNLRRAIDHDELRLYYQPKVDVANGRITGAEALVRWQHPTLGVIGPAGFITVAEECGAILALGDWVLNEACRQISEWRQAGLLLPRVAVNVSLHQFRQADFAEKVAATLATHGLEGRQVILELTESAVMEDSEQSLRSLARLRELGIELAVDDFGTGYSSLSYLTRFPLNELKVDRSFLASVDSDRHSATLVAAIISMGHQLGLRVVAEGVETEQQLQFLREHHCNEYQGYFCSKPLPETEFRSLLIAAG